MSKDTPPRFDRPIFPDQNSAGGGSGASNQDAVGRQRFRWRLSVQARLLLFFLLVIVVLGSVGYAYLRPKEKVFTLDTYQFTTVGRRDFRELVYVEGVVVLDQVRALAAPVDARVVQIMITPGDDVKPGQTLMQLSSRDLDSGIAEAEDEVLLARLEWEQARLKATADEQAAREEVKEAEAAWEAAKEDLPLVEKLYELGGQSKQELDEARRKVQEAEEALEAARDRLNMVEKQNGLALKRAEQKVLVAESTLAELKRQRDALTVRADGEGRILAVNVDAGDLVTAGAALLELGDITRQHVEVNTSTNQARFVRPGQLVTLRSGSNIFPAQVASVSPRATASEDGAGVPVQIRLEREVAQQLRPNEPVTCEIEIGIREDRPYVRRGPFFASGDTSFVYRIDEDFATAERREVVYGLVDGQYIEVEDGLEVGDRIIYSSYSAFRAYREIRLEPEGGREVE